MPLSLLSQSYFSLKEGGRLRYGIFGAIGAEKGTILVVPGRREFIEKKHAELYPRLSRLGYKLIIVEPRGQGLSTRFLSGAEHQRDFVENFWTPLEDILQFVRAIVEPSLTRPLIFHGHSQGAHLVLRYLVENKISAKCFLTAPMLALGNLPAFLAQGSYALSLASVRLGLGTHYAPKQTDFGRQDCEYRDNFLTHDENKFRIIETYFAQFPELTVGGVTWSWLRAALNSMTTTHDVDYLSRITGPLLVLVGDEDRVTPAAENLQHLQRIPSMQSMIVRNARHDVLNESDAIVSPAWQEIEKFLG